MFGSGGNGVRCLLHGLLCGCSSIAEPKKGKKNQRRKNERRVILAVKGPGTRGPNFPVYVSVLFTYSTVLFFFRFQPGAVHWNLNFVRLRLDSRYFAQEPKRQKCIGRFSRTSLYVFQFMIAFECKCRTTFMQLVQRALGDHRLWHIWMTLLIH